MTNIIADIAGHYQTLMALIEKMPKGDLIFVGDLVDRGPRSKEVIEFAMQNGKVIMGNHEHMMLDACRDQKHYDPATWIFNGGEHTLRSFGADGDYIDMMRNPEKFTGVVPDEVLDWIADLPLYLEVDNCLIAHSFIKPGLDLEQVCKIGELPIGETIFWNRREPERIEKYRLQIAGHNSQFGLRDFIDDQGKFAICLDACKSKVLTGLHLPTMEVFQQEYID